MRERADSITADLTKVHTQPRRRITLVCTADSAVARGSVSAASSWPAPRRHLRGGDDYIEFSVTDVAEAERFYAAAFGREFNDYGPDYAGIKKHDGEAGGLCRAEELRPGGPLVVLYSSDLSHSLEQVRTAGGRIVKEPFAFPGGRRFHFADPSGNELAVWSDR